MVLPGRVDGVDVGGMVGGVVVVGVKIVVVGGGVVVVGASVVVG